MSVKGRSYVMLDAPIDVVFGDQGTLDDLLWGLGAPTPIDASAIPNGNAPLAGSLGTIAGPTNVLGPLCLFVTPGLEGGYFANWPGLGGGVPALGPPSFGGVTASLVNRTPAKPGGLTQFRNSSILALQTVLRTENQSQNYRCLGRERPGA